MNNVSTNVNINPTKPTTGKNMKMKPRQSVNKMIRDGWRVNIGINTRPKNRRPLSKAALAQRAILLKRIGPTIRLIRLTLGEDTGTGTRTTTITRVTGTRTTTGTSTGAKMGDRVPWRI